MLILNFWMFVYHGLIFIYSSLDNYGIGLVLRSEGDKYPPGVYLFGFHCTFFLTKKHIRFDTDDKFIRVLSAVFQQYSVRNNTDIIFPWIPLQKPPGLSWSLFVGTLGMPGT